MQAPMIFDDAAMQQPAPVQATPAKSARKGLSDITNTAKKKQSEARSFGGPRQHQAGPAIAHASAPSTHGFQVFEEPEGASRFEEEECMFSEEDRKNVLALQGDPMKCMAETLQAIVKGAGGAAGALGMQLVDEEDDEDIPHVDDSLLEDLELDMMMMSEPKEQTETTRENVEDFEFDFGDD